ncbi:hypothetical protein SANA_07820 [Gottschalkiaceae bacterium SANA]|nr:hypothetical protein SANA_07820 [Gottschalkiaceae bacterium SANA]
MSEAVNNSYCLETELIYKQYHINKNELKLVQSKDFVVLPFRTSSINTDIKQISKIVSACFRNTLNIKDIELKNSEELIDEIAQTVTTDDKKVFKHLLTSLYVEENQLIKFHPRMFVYGGKSSSGIKNIANYLTNNLFSNNIDEALSGIITSEANVVIEELIMEHTPLAIPQSAEKKTVDFCLIPEIREMFEKDLLFLCTSQKKFLDNVEKLITFYLFFITSQTILALRRGFDDNESNIQNVFYFLDWEKVSRSRTGYQQGWKMIEKRSENIFAYVNLLQILNMTKNRNFKGSFADISCALSELSEFEMSEFKKDVVEINNKILSIIGYDRQGKVKKSISKEYDCLNELLQTLIDAKDKGNRRVAPAYERYQKNIKSIAALGLLKARGQLGNTLNLNQEWIIFLTRLCIGERDKIRLNELWEELAKRGVNFDKYSREMIISYFEKINILEKKSDSGDAQYVRVL